MTGPRLIGLVGRSRAGKDTVGGMLAGPNPSAWVLMSFALPIKKICMGIFKFTDDQLHGATKDTPDPRYKKADGTYLLPREPMKMIGQAARECYPHIWAELGVESAKESKAFGFNVAFTDCRFVNEGRLIKEEGGQLWRIIRPEAEAVPAVHISEWEMNTPAMGKLIDKVIYNNDTLEVLKERVEKALTGNESRVWELCKHDILQIDCKECR